MPDPLAVALTRLAPTVDLAASRELFERSRDGAAGGEPPRPRHDRLLLAAACVLLLVAGVAGVWAVAARDDAAPAAGPTAAVPGDGTEFEVVAVERVGDVDARSVRAAGSYDDLVSIVSRYGPTLAPRAADVDFDTHVAVVVERGGSSSPDELARFRPVGDEWVAEWREPGGDTEDVGVGYVYLIAVERTALTGVDWFVTPAEQHGSVAWDELRIAVPRRLTAPAKGTEFRVVAREPVGDPERRSIAVASTDDALAALLAGYRDDFDRFADDVNLGRELAVVIEQPANACPPDLERFLPSDRAWRVQWAPQSADPCEDIGLGWVYLVAVERSALTAVDTILLPAAPASSEPEIGAAVRDASIGPIVTTFESGGIDGVVPAQDVAAFTDQTGWDRYAAERFDGSPEAAIGLDRYVVVVFRLADDGGTCAGAIERFDVAGDVWTAVFTDAAGSCDTGPITMTQAVAVERAALPDRVTFALAADDERGVPAASVTVDVAGAADGPAAFELVASGELPVEPGALGVATSRTTLDALRVAFGIEDELPSIDFERDVALVFTVEDDTCRARFDGFDRGPGAPYPTWVVRLTAPDGQCEAPVTTFHTVAVRRAAIEDGVVFALPPTQRYGAGEVTAAVDPRYSVVSTRWSCGPAGGPTFAITLDLPGAVDVVVEVVDGDEVTGRGLLGNDDAGTFGIEFGMSGEPSTTSEAVVTDAATRAEVARVPLADLDIAACD